MAKHGVIRAHLFGSAANGIMTDDSDINFMVSFKLDLNYTEYGDNYFQLMYALQSLLKKNVDLVAEETIPPSTSKNKRAKDCCFMTTEEKKLLTDILVGISSIDDHLEGRRILEE
ncbi:Nucleotidyltransferase domain-containing protein [Pedobacter westerhofensis]|uniref:Nucleotidyltransferase domain-containing protein n=2 Tax=Pedobacter westerhofensis TaxID=425512 RepID=A0A521EYW1_9SPHI|nr:Nucleotidyltransferase domain-containing protein [Pedobacter westerhofensis]